MKVNKYNFKFKFKIFNRAGTQLILLINWRTTTSYFLNHIEAKV